LKRYPISVRRFAYRGSDERKLRQNCYYNDLAAKIENYINQALSEESDHTIKVFLADSVADAIREDYQEVRKVISGIDGGYHGVTVVKGDMNIAFQKRSVPNGGLTPA